MATTTSSATRNPSPGAALEEAAADAYFVGIRSATQLERGFFESASRLTGVGCFCIGTNQVDLAAAEERGIPVFNAPFSNTRSVAELVLAEIIMLMRGIPERNAAAHRGGWLKTADRQPRSARQDARHRRLRPHRHAGRRAGRIARHAGGVSTTSRRKLALGNAKAARPRSTRCSKRATSSRCTCPKRRPPSR